MQTQLPLLGRRWAISMSQEQPEIAGFKIRERIGKSGMATVYLAEDVSCLPVAIKAINSEGLGGKELCEQFAQEASIIGRLRHSSIIRVYRYGVDGPWHYLVTEYLPGGDLKTRIRTRMTVDAAVDVTRRLAGALGAAHEEGLVHQDVKPENVLFRSTGTPVLMDFGIVSQAGQRNKGMSGTPLYMSPEQVQGHTIDRRTDIYCLGCMLFEMLTGAPPYPLSSMEAILYAQVHRPVPSLPGDLHSLQGLIDQMMCKRLEGRLGSAQEVLTLLDAHWLLAPERTGDPKAALAAAAAKTQRITDPSIIPTRRSAAPVPAVEAEVSDPLMETYELARTYLNEGDIKTGREMLFTIAVEGRGEVAQLAKELLDKLSG